MNHRQTLNEAEGKMGEFQAGFSDFCVQSDAQSRKIDHAEINTRTAGNVKTKIIPQQSSKSLKRPLKSLAL